ncbi:dolichol-phosphate mannose synthase subunit 3-like isoform X2 [Curcuma longa]|uniref:dolichol-phosphate mannose synthase subunit 3-like isoform X2 n=1 Tax=Curcuma longa TaxID=136217 RepID=UPI003D9F22F5
MNPEITITSNCSELKMKHILKILALLVAVAAIWISLLETSVAPRHYMWLLPVYLIISLGCYGLLMVGIGLMLFPTCPQEAVLLQKDIVEAKEFLIRRGVDVGSD